MESSQFVVQQPAPTGGWADEDAFPYSGEGERAAALAVAEERATAVGGRLVDRVVTDDGTVYTRVDTVVVRQADPDRTVTAPLHLWVALQQTISGAGDAGIAALSGLIREQLGF